jgi:hypothetical protein
MTSSRNQRVSARSGGEHMKKSRRSVHLLRLALLLAAAGPGCGGGSQSTNVDAGSMSDADAGGDDAPVPYQGPTSGGSIPLPPISEADASYDVIVEADNRCCNVTLALADPTADETAATLIGNLFPLDVSGGMALTHSDGAWRASACLPVNVAIEYAFSFTVPFGARDPDGGIELVPPDGAVPTPTDTDAGLEDDAGSPDAADALVEDPPATMIELRYDPAVPQIPDGLGGFRNVFGPVSDCASIGATTGTLQ